MNREIQGVERLVSMGREIYSEISAGFWGIVAVTGNQDE